MKTPLYETDVPMRPLTPEEIQSIHEALETLDRGECYTTDEVRAYVDRKHREWLRAAGIQTTH